MVGNVESFPPELKMVSLPGKADVLEHGNVGLRIAGSHQNVAADVSEPVTQLRICDIEGGDIPKIPEAPSAGMGIDASGIRIVALAADGVGIADRAYPHGVARREGKDRGGLPA